MMIQLPKAFAERMKRLLGEEEYKEFEKSYEKERHQALRVNTIKISAEDFCASSPFSLRQVPWVKEGFYYSGKDRPGKHSWHEAGLYYIQEPSAMAVAALADARPGERVLDLCAAPGGKTTQLAASMKGEGLLVSNEIHPARAKILAQNVERMGISNALVTNESPQALAERFFSFFDKIVVDAPCSGEGMFRKEEQALEHWSLENVELCAARQQEILEEAAKMLRPGGRLVYSTCTFAPEENEGSISRFLEKHEEFQVEKVQAYAGFAPGHPEWVQGPDEVKDTWRLWPHRLDGEGHYAAVLKKRGNGGAAGDLAFALENPISSTEGREKKRRGKSGKQALKGSGPVDKVSLQAAVKAYEAFAAEHLRPSFRERLQIFCQGRENSSPKQIAGENYLLFGEQLYGMPEPVSLEGLKVLRPGLHLGTFSKNRFEPSHALALALRAEDAVRSLSLAGDGAQVQAYLRGETLETELEKGWCLVLADGYSLGWGKVSAGILKNHYPRGLRWQ